MIIFLYFRLLEDCLLALVSDRGKYFGNKMMVIILFDYIRKLIRLLFLLHLCTMVHHVSEPVVKVPINLSESKMYVIYILH